MKEILIEAEAYYIFDLGYNNFKELYRLHRADHSLLSGPMIVETAWVAIYIDPGIGSFNTTETYHYIS